MDTAGIEPATFRLQSGRAATAPCAQYIHNIMEKQYTIDYKNTDRGGKIEYLTGLSHRKHPY